MSLGGERGRRRRERERAAREGEGGERGRGRRPDSTLGTASESVSGSGSVGAGACRHEWMRRAASTAAARCSRGMSRAHTPLPAKRFLSLSLSLSLSPLLPPSLYFVRVDMKQSGINVESRLYLSLSHTHTHEQTRLPREDLIRALQAHTHTHTHTHTTRY